MAEQAWQGWDDEQVAADAESVAGDDGFFKMKAREEPYLVRFLPARRGEGSAIQVLHQHYFEFPDKTKFVFNCPKLMAREHCDGCAMIEKMRDSGSTADEKLAKRFMPKVRVLSRLINREAEGKGPRIFGFGKMIFDELKILRKNANRGGDFTDPTDRGYDIELLASGEGMEREYKVYAAARQPLASPEQVQEWLETMPSLERFAKILPREAIQAGLRLNAGLVAPAPARRFEEPRAITQATTRTLEGRPAPVVAPSRRPARDDDESPF